MRTLEQCKLELACGFEKEERSGKVVRTLLISNDVETTKDNRWWTAEVKRHEQNGFRYLSI